MFCQHLLRRWAAGLADTDTSVKPKYQPDILAWLIGLSLVKSNYSRICLICHLKGIRKKWWFRRSDELCKQV